MVATEGGFYQILADIPKKPQNSSSTNQNRPQQRWILDLTLIDPARPQIWFFLPNLTQFLNQMTFC